MNKNLFIYTLIASATSFLSSSACFAQTFSPGEIVYSSYDKDEVKVIKQDSSGVHCLVKDWKDHDFKPGGSSRYYQPGDLSKINPNAQAAMPAGGGGGGGGGGGAFSAGSGTYVPDVQANNGGGGGSRGGGAADLGGSGPLSKDQIIGYLRANVGTDGPHPKKEAISDAVVAAIKKRGVNFKYGWQDMPDFSKAGGTTSVTYALADNYGTPPTMAWLTATWELSFTKMTGWVSSMMNENAHKKGFLLIEPGHTYVWKIHQDDKPEAWIEGKWREATPAEMKYQGGAQIVLLNGEQNYDWIVHKDMTAPEGQNWINVADLQTRQIKRGGLKAR